MKNKAQLPVLSGLILLFFCWSLPGFSQSIPDDWLVDSNQRPAQVITDSDSQIRLENGLISRSFHIGKNLICYDFTNQMTGAQLLRSPLPEAEISINGKVYQIGGKINLKEKAFFKPEWLDQVVSPSNHFRYDRFTQEKIESLLDFEILYWPYEAKYGTGIKLTFWFNHIDLPGFSVAVHYELFDNLPLISKYLTIENKSNTDYLIDQIVSEQLAIVEEESAVVGSTSKMKKNHQIYFENNFAFNNAMHAELSDQATHWLPDSSYTSQVNYDLLTPAIAKIFPDKGYGIILSSGESLLSIRSNQLILDSYDRERNGLARRKMYRALAPWTTQNPIFMHLVSKTDQEVYTAIEQCVETGYEAVILSFGSHINMEDDSDENLNRWKKMADYAHEKGIKIGGYSLFSSRTISPEDDVIDPKTGKPGGAFFGNAPCLASNWGLNYIGKIKNFYQTTGFDLFENDGPYPGDVCASSSHPGHMGLEDSQWVQLNLQKELYHWMNERGIYINAPDWYFLDGSHKIAMGYREVNFSLSRTQQKILNRQNIYDATWEKTPSMGWGFVPLTAYHGGGADAVLEPLNEHLADYKMLMMQYYGAGIQACYRGPRLYDTDETKAMVIEVIDWYKKYRSILNADIIRLRRADGREWDGWMHVDPQGKEKALIMLFNPLDQTITRKLRIPVYYTGLTGQVELSEQEGVVKKYTVSTDNFVEIEVEIPPNYLTWFTLK
jgi:hypothetical protein